MATPVLTQAQFTNVMEALQPGSSQYPQGIAEAYAQYTQNPEQYANTLPGAGGSDISQRFNSYAALVQGQGTGSGATAASAAPAQSYLSSSAGGSPVATYGMPGGGTTTDPSGAASTQGEQPPDINYARAYLRQMAGVPDFATNTAWDANVSDQAVMDFWNKQHPAPAQAPAPVDTTQPETRALQQMAQIDPTSEALRNQLGMSYLANLNQTQAPTFTPGQAPNAADVQGYLDLYRQIDPQGYAQRAAMTQQVSDYVTKATGQAPTSAADALSKYSQLDPQGYAQYGQLSGAMGSYLSTAQQQAALGSQLDPQTLRELEQSTRQGQAARGNVYGTPQLVAEAMTRGQAGMAIQQQREAALGQAGTAMQNYLTSGATTGALGQNLYQQGLANQQNALGVQQGYLSSGQSLGDIANTLYGQGFSRNLSQYQQQLAALNMAQQGAQGYLGSGQTPYQAGSSYLNMAQQNAASAAQGGPQYNPSSLSPGMTGTSQQAPQYGLDIGAQGQNYYQAMGYQNMMQPQSQSSIPSYIGAAANVAGSLAKAYTGAPKTV